MILGNSVEFFFEFAALVETPGVLERPKSLIFPAIRQFSDGEQFAADYVIRQNESLSPGLFA
jgi:hypothetical protein